MSSLPGNPFVGLRPFESKEALLFFGRDEQTIELLERLHRARFLAVVGGSGCGKSSLIRAGLISKLRAGLLVQEHDRWLVVTMKPGAKPLKALTIALTRLFSQEGSFDGEIALDEPILESVHSSLLKKLTPALEEARANLLLVIDQFEELFRFGVDTEYEEQSEEAAAFVSLILTLAEQLTLPIYVVITIRSDYLGECDAFRGLPEAMNSSQYLVPRLSRRQRREAIEGPIRLYRRRIAPRLVDRLLNDGGDEADHLPVMQHALMRLWEEGQNSDSFDLQHYRAIGGLESALSRHAEEALAGMETENLKLTESIFRALTFTDAKRRRVRRPIVLNQIVFETGGSYQKIIDVIDSFRGDGRSFLMPPEGVPLVGDTLIDISHESLIRQWKRLREWVDREAESANIYLRLVEGAKRFAAHKGNLLVDLDLKQALEWKEESNPGENWAKRYGNGYQEAIGFLENSHRKYQADLVRTRRRQRELELAREQRRFVRAVSTTLLIVSLLSIVAFRQWWVAQQNISIANYNLAKVFEEKAGTALSDLQDEGNPTKNYQIAWLYTLAALNQKVGEKGLPVSVGRFLSPEISASAYREIWRTPIPSTSVRREIFDVAFSPDGKRLASVGSDNVIRLWDVDSGQLLKTLHGHLDSVLSVAFSPDGRRLASGSNDKTIRLWDFETGQNLRGPLIQKAPVWSVVFSPDGNVLASAGPIDTEISTFGPVVQSDKQSIRLWDVETMQPLTPLQGHTPPVWSLAFSPDGKILASGSDDPGIRLGDQAFQPDNRSVQLWDVETMLPLASLQGHSAPVWSVAFSPNGKLLASGSDDRSIRLWDVEKKTEYHLVPLLEGHRDSVRSVAFSPDGKRLASGSFDQSIRLWDVGSGELLATLQGHRGPVRSVAFSPDGKRLASGSFDESARLWDVEMGQGRKPLKGHTASVFSVAFSSPSGNHLVSGSSDNSVRLWDIETGESLVSLQMHEDWVRSVAFSPSGKLVASGSRDKDIRLWDVKTGESRPPLRGHTDAIFSVAFSPNGEVLASGALDQTIRLWDVENSHEIRTPLQGHQDAIWDVAFSPDGKLLASGSKDKYVRLWDVVTGESLRPLQGHSGGVRCVAFSPDSKFLASGSVDKIILLWDVDTGESRSPLRGHDGEVRDVEFSPDGLLLASGSFDQSILLWDVRTGQHRATLEGHKDAILSVAFSPDGKRLASGSEDRSIHIWDVYRINYFKTRSGKEVLLDEVFRASLHMMDFRLELFRLIPTPRRLIGYNQKLSRPRPPDKEPLEWILENTG